MIGFDQAVAHIRSVAAPLGTETVTLAEAAGRVLAAPVVAQVDSPRTNVSAMDGYALREADLAAFPVSLKVVGESFAGAGWCGVLDRGRAARIFTGAPLPAGADRIVIQEDVRRDRRYCADRPRPRPRPAHPPARVRLHRGRCAA